MSASTIPHLHEAESNNWILTDKAMSSAAIAEALLQLYSQAPVPRCSYGVLNTLYRLARDLDFEATRAFLEILAIELKLDRKSLQTTQANSPVELLTDNNVPALLRIYALGLVPRDFVVQAANCGATASEVFNDVDVAAFKRMVIRESPLQHELMQAFVLAALIINFEMVATLRGNPVPAGAKLAMLDQILGHCKIVPGNNSTSKFEFGRDLILRLTPGGLLTIIGHELGHHREMVGSPDLTEESALDEFLETVHALPQQLSRAAKNKGNPIAPRDERVFHTSSGLSLVCTFDEASRGPYTHLSLAIRGGPIELDRAARLAYPMLLVLDVDPSLTAALYTPRGCFHFGFAGTVSSSVVQQRLSQLNLNDLFAHSEAQSLGWLDALEAAGRLGENELDLPGALVLLEGPSRFYAVDQDASRRDWSMRNRIRSTGNLTSISPDEFRSRFSAAIRCGDAQSVRAMVGAGPTDQVPLVSLGASLCVVGDCNRRVYLGPTAGDILDILETLHAIGCDLNQPFDDAGHTLLTEATLDKPELLPFLLSHGADVNRANGNGETPLAVASRFADVAVVRQLVEAGAQTTVRDKNGNTPLHAAVEQQRDEELVLQLIQAGANVNAVNDSSRTRLLYARSPALVRVLQGAGADIDASASDRKTLLMSAAQDGQIELVRTLLACGADANAATDLDETATHFAAAARDEEAGLACLHMLIDAGADVNEETRGGLTPLMIGVSRGSDKIVDLLIQSKANINAADQTGRTPLHMALEQSQINEGLIARLLQAGADETQADDAGVSAASLATSPEIPDKVRQMIKEKAATGG